MATGLYFHDENVAQFIFSFQIFNQTWERFKNSDLFKSTELVLLSLRVLFCSSQVI